MSPKDPFRFGAAGIDLSGRLFRTATVAASPADATETIVASLTIGEDLAVAEGVLLWAYAAYTVGTNGVSVLPRIRRTNAAGTVIIAGGAQTSVAANLDNQGIQGFDSSPSIPGQVYVLTLTVGSATAASTVSAVELVALVV